MPKVLPKHVYPVAPPQLASGDTLFVGVDAGGEAMRVDEVLITVAERVELAFEVASLPVHEPNDELQPVPQ